MNSEDVRGVYLSVLWNYYAYTYSFFDSISHTVCKKTGHLLLGLSSKVLNRDYLFGHRSDFFNNLTIVFSNWPEDHKIRYLSSSTNIVGLHFHEGVEKMKENDKNTKTENLQNGQEKYGGKKLAYVYMLGQKLKKNYDFFKF